MKIAALVPTLYRPAGLELALRSIRSTAPEVTLVVAVEADDIIGIAIAVPYGAKVAICQQPRAGCAYAWNTALAAAPDYDAYVIASDDAEFLPGWLVATKDALTRRGFVGLYANWKKTEYSFFYAMTREFIIKHHGGVAAVPHYRVWGVDTEACERAKRAGQYYKTQQQFVIHHHGKDMPSKEDRIAVKKIYNRRKELGWPDDFEPIIK